MLPISDGSAFDQLKLLVDREGDNLAGPDWLDPLSDLTTYSGVPGRRSRKTAGWAFGILIAGPMRPEGSL